MVFVIQHPQNKDTKAIQLKLNELIAANCDASKRLVSIEDLTDDELEVIKKYYMHLAKAAKTDTDIFATHSLDEAKQNSVNKSREKTKQKIKTT
jgi:low affinity Fe/Cu permease